MLNYKRPYVLLFVAVILCSCTGISHYGPSPKYKFADPQVRTLRRQLNGLFNDPAFANAHWGVMIKSLDSGELLYSRLASKGFLPASNMKLFPTATGLAKLGPDFTWETRLLARGPIENGILKGDLYVLGSGDPSFSSRFHDGDPLAPFKAWAQELRKRGISKIEGGIIGDDDCFDDDALAWGWDHGYLHRWYAAETNGLCLNDNCYLLRITPGKSDGAAVSIDCTPPLVYGELVVNATTLDKDTEPSISIARAANGNRIVVSGAMPSGGKAKAYSVSVHNNTLFFTNVLKRVLMDSGIAMQGAPLDIDDLNKSAYSPDKMTLLASYNSPPLSRIIASINKPSQNLYSEQLHKTLGARLGGEGSFDGGYEVIKQFLEEEGVDASGLRMADGSGLSRLDLVQPQHIIGLLEVMHRHKDFAVFYDSLPIAGVDGTIRRRMRDTSAQGNVHAKTGFIGRVRSLSGYVTTRDGEMLAFSMMTNNYTVPTAKANRIQDKACELLADFSRR
jgi:serine-type D-Ala-D-Ala carboxypeptidase/endopeptidase (penicillin-binding protein 4)